MTDTGSHRHYSPHTSDAQQMMHSMLTFDTLSLYNNIILLVTSVQAGAVLMPLAMFLLSLKSIRVLSIMNFILKLAYLYKVTEKKRLIYMHLL